MRYVDYHNHTYLCEHATGMPEEYIRRALELGLAEIGFSDHAPLPEGLREGITMRPEQIETYIALIEEQREIYRDRIGIRIGFEVDYPLHDSFPASYLTDNRLDYLIGSCHFLEDWAFDHPDFQEEFHRRDIDGVYQQYYGILNGLIQTGHFQILGHLDLVKKFGHRSLRSFEDEISRLGRALSGGSLSVELNTAGLRKPVGEIYPSPRILEILFENNVPVTLGSDSHLPEEVGYEFSRAAEILRSCGYRSISGYQRKKRYDVPL